MANRPCRSHAPGPKLRIASLPGRHARLRLRKVSPGQPTNLLALDGSGRPGSVEPDTESEMPVVAVDAGWLASLDEGDRVECVDARGRERTLRVETRTGAGQVILATPSGLAIETGTELVHRAADGVTTSTGRPIQCRLRHQVQPVADGHLDAPWRRRERTDERAAS